MGGERVPRAGVWQPLTGIDGFAGAFLFGKCAGGADFGSCMCGSC